MCSSDLLECRTDERRSPAAATPPEAAFRLRRLSPVARGDHSRLAIGAGRLRGPTDRRGEVAVLPVAGAGQAGPNGRRLTAHLPDEGPGRRPPGQRSGGPPSLLVSRFGRERGAPS